ncbi:MAG: hypothetical protein IJ801_06325 [Lachnospiraceae bacterium]|nr:hypothetical protein [Lachnospiraceae bacterium]
MAVITHNILAMNAQRQYNITSKKKAKNTEKLASGYKINRASDDAAGLSISEKLRNQIRNLNQGISNSEDGIHMCKVGDGALNEVGNIIHRMKELAVRAANDVLDDGDRQAVDNEYQLLKEEINKIGHDTEFNGIPLFRGRDVEIGAAGTTFGDVEYSQIELGFANIRLVEGPFTQSSSAQTLRCAVKTSDGTDVSGADWNLIYGNGNTSYSSVRIGIVDEDGNVGSKVSIPLNGNDITVSDFHVNESSKTWSRTLSYNKNGIQFQLQQTVKVADKTANEQYYEISYQFKNTSNKRLSVDFMYNCDTAYNNDDHCEGYFIDNMRVGTSTLYTTNTNLLAQDNPDIQNGIPTTFSIFNQESALQFTEKISIDSTNVPDILSLGKWTAVDKWRYYEENQLGSSLGKSLVDGSYGADLAFSMIWNDRVFDSGDQQTFGLKQGMAAAITDQNVSALPRTLNTERLTRHDNYNSLWIQSGANSGEDMELIFEEMNCDVLGLRGSAVDSRDKAVMAMEEVEDALRSVNGNRSKIGAQQNRLEYTIQHEMNYSENMTSAEANIRDTDMTTEMVKLSMHSILEQAGQAMLAQANQQSQGVLQLLQG